MTSLVPRGRFKRQRCHIDRLLMTSQYHHCLQILTGCSKINFLHNVYFGFLILSKLTIPHHFVTYLSNDPRTLVTWLKLDVRNGSAWMNGCIYTSADGVTTRKITLPAPWSSDRHQLQKVVKLNYFCNRKFQLNFKFCNPNYSMTEALTHTAFHKPPKPHQIQCITVEQCQPVPVSK